MFVHIKWHCFILHNECCIRTKTCLDVVTVQLYRVYASICDMIRNKKTGLPYPSTLTRLHLMWLYYLYGSEVSTKEKTFHYVMKNCRLHSTQKNASSNDTGLLHRNSQLLSKLSQVTKRKTNQHTDHRETHHNLWTTAGLICRVKKRGHVSNSGAITGLNASSWNRTVLK
jgi:hypothetical protein